MIQYKYMEEEDHFTQTQLPALIAALTDAALGSPSFSLLFSLLCSLSRCLFIGNNGGCQLQLFFNNGGCQPLTLGMGCCICQWTVSSINGCCTLMATNPTITPFAIHVGQLSSCFFNTGLHVAVLPSLPFWERLQSSLQVLATPFNHQSHQSTPFSHTKGSLQPDGLPLHIWRVLTLVSRT